MKFVDLSGKRFGRLLVLCLSDKKGSHKELYWWCLCNCGACKEIRGSLLTQEKVQSCGCYHSEVARVTGSKKKESFVGRHFGRLVVVSEAEPKISSGRSSTRWLCKCECGRETIVTSINLKHGHTTSCGCYIQEKMRKGLRFVTGESKTKEYKRAKEKIRSELKVLHDTEWTPLMEKSLCCYFSSCVLCGSKEKLTTDHVKPLSRGFGLFPGNAVILCMRCNSSKRDRMPDELSNITKERLLFAAESFRVAWSGGF